MIRLLEWPRIRTTFNLRTFKQIQTTKGFDMLHKQGSGVKAFKEEPESGFNSENT
jgi:hypothetical protein